MSEPSPADLSTLTDLATPWCVHAAVTLRVAEHIAAGTTDIADLATATGCDREALHNVLGHLAGKGVFAEPAPGHFALNETAKQLLDPAVRIGLDLEGIGGRLAGAWSTLPNYVRTGEPGYAEAFGLPFWEDLDAHPDLAASFDELIGPTGHGTPDTFEIAGGWGGVGHVVDVGGGTGAMLAELLRVHGHLHGTLVDLPRTVARSPGILAEVADRVTTVGQSFFDPLPSGADLYLLRGVLNDWPDHEATAILRRCAEAAEPNGRVVVLKGVGPDEGHRGLSIEMVLLGGRHRTISELRELAAAAGLEVTAAVPHGTRFVVECRPA
ncbi:MAG: O-methyltransferase [uncultured Acidimicrobiales bacterium]|uniref:O-methyltransferase n=1 Tax=uncultured Acidimicrobiales bacterium TaxID=310071 RepID=A0A6J4IC59_9ACTN|nr:MAG: O-methyltransferase [uncultured Acidimicrobiales bacterium]